jgi:NAD(P)-dependent dehydrogenase (short-subunit alcohol dehydrogenase family)
MENSFASYPSLRGKNILITGGASGIGKELVKAFAEQGSNVGFLDLNNEAGEQLCIDIGKNVFFQKCDLKEVVNLKSSIEKLRTKIGLFDVLVNNAAHDDRHNWQEVTEAYWDERFATNLRHHFFTIQSLANDMIEKGGGSIVNIGSNSWMEAVGNFPAYATAKSAVHGLSRTLARDLGKHRIRVNTVVPGWIMTDRQKELWVTSEGLENQYKRQCLPDLIEPVYVARMVLFLASDDGAMCTANNYMVEAGSI